MDSLWEFIQQKRCEIRGHEITGFRGKDEMLLVIKYTQTEKKNYLNESREHKHYADGMNQQIINKITDTVEFKAVFTDFFQNKRPEPVYDLSPMFLMAWKAPNTGPN